jgi:galactokinase
MNTDTADREQGGIVEARAKLVRVKFKEIIGTEPAIIVRAPGRVNLIGEHTDYNDGFVLPVAIDRAVFVAASPRPDRWVHIYAQNFDRTNEFPLDDIGYDNVEPWSNYPRGVAQVLQSAGFTLTGIDAVLWGDVPIGSGLSSSAATEVAIGYTFQVLSGLHIEPTELAVLCQRAENQFVGMSCGIMDQFIACLGRRGHALLIDCRDLSHDHVPIPSGIRVVVADTMKRRELVSSEYNARRRECSEGAQLLGVKALRDVSVSDFEWRQGELPDVVRRRVRHVVYENQRVLDGVAALRQGDVAAFGRLMNESHRSLRDDYEVSCRELDVMAEAAWHVDGVYGSRLTGAGFGGCTVSLVAEAAVPTFVQQVAAEYRSKIGIELQIYICAVEEGVRTL